MKEEAIVQAAVLLLTQIEKETRPASETINAFTRMHKSFGSKDRRKLTDLVWQCIRHKARLEYAYPNKTWEEKINLFLTKEPSFPKDMPFHVQVETPQWLISKIKNADKELPALLENPSIILRCNGDRTFIQKKLFNEGVETSLTEISPYGLVLNKRTNLQSLETFKNGLIEVQDEGSQLVALSTEIKPNEIILDYCAGAGGKSLIFAQMMQGKGKILAHDVSKQSLNELEKRATRANIKIIETTTNIPSYLKSHPHVKFSHVVVDAPCSGTGTWRRCPDARWKLTEEEFSGLLKKQQMILRKASVYVAQGAFLSYMTCSLTEDENILQVRKFLKTNSQFKLITHKQFSPYRSNTDGLFVAIMQRER